MGRADSGLDFGWFTRCVFDIGPDRPRNELVQVYGQSNSYKELASKFHHKSLITR